MSFAKNANLALSFILELCLLAAFAVWGFTTGIGLPMQLLLGIGTPVLAAVVWGIFMAPKAVRPIHPPLHQIAELVIFGLAFVALYLAGQTTLTILFAVVYGINSVLRILWRD